jgi:hypothetical protein
MLPPMQPYNVHSFDFNLNDPISELASSLSGSLADYRLVSSAPGEVVITAVDSYKERFRRTKTELSKVVEKLNEMEKDREALRRAQVYSTILTGKPLEAYAPFDFLKLLDRTQ